jgi:hypothetical protein
MCCNIDKCISYTFYEGDWVLNSCEEGYKLDNFIKCGSCDDGYTQTSEEVLDCVYYSEISPYNEDDDNNYEDQSLEQGEEDVISQAQKERGEIVHLASKSKISAVLASCSISAAVFMNPILFSCYLILYFLI